MCKPQMRELRIHSDGPCGFTVKSYADACSAFSVATSWRARISNVLRRWADEIDGVQTIAISGYGPPQMMLADSFDATEVGINAATKYLNDLWRDRVFGSEDVAVGTLQQTRPIVE